MPRAWIPALVFWLLLVVLTGYVHGLSYPPAPTGSRHVLIGLFVSSAVVFGILLLNFIDLFGKYQTFAHENDARVALVEAAAARGDRVAIVPRYTHELISLMHLSGHDDRFCMSQFYGLDAIVVEQ